MPQRTVFGVDTFKGVFPQMTTFQMVSDNSKEIFMVMLHIEPWTKFVSIFFSDITPQASKNSLAVEIVPLLIVVNKTCVSYL